MSGLLTGFKQQLLTTVHQQNAQHTANQIKYNSINTTYEAYQVENKQLKAKNAELIAKVSCLMTIVYSTLGTTHS